MVVTKHLAPIKTEMSLKRGIRYILNSEKTTADYFIESDLNFPNQILPDGEIVSRLISGHMVSDLEKAGSEFLQMKQLANLTKGRAINHHLKNANTVLAHHIVQSFSPEDNLTPEEVHEIGRKTIMELTGGEYAFVIATHLDQGHLHNHIFFNSTNEVTLNQFRWQKGTKKSLEQISDKHAELAGAKILSDRSIFDHKAYQAYRKQNSYKTEIKSRLQFAMRFSKDLEDFKSKAKELSVEVNFSRKHATYKLLDQPQQKNTRARQLDKRGRFEADAITAALEKQIPEEVTSPLQELYYQEQEEEQLEYEMQLKIEPWQVEYETATGIYLKVDFGLQNQGTVKIPYRHLEKQEDGSFQVFIKRSDFFYFLNPDKSTSNRYMKGATLLKQLSYESGEYTLTKNKRIAQLDKLFSQFEYLASRDVLDRSQFQELGTSLVDKMEEVQQLLDMLDGQIAKLNKISAALQDLQADRPVNEFLSIKILEEYNVPLNTPVAEVVKEVVEVTVEKQTLEEKYEAVLNELEQYREIEKSGSSPETEKEAAEEKSEDRYL
ncbi:relaxase/mobilization nuclease domain-containing protein [Streptococcus ovis]|uniref:relaxase/mobilization nuclease domain-containing protein n=1 Tax=Streptococcus ovis TaxID=82806 RepID=UPI0003703B30|nr:relaxase/mobilization nuclease domain-containing protein [Streptococcus ovis]